MKLLSRRRKEKLVLNEKLPRRLVARLLKKLLKIEQKEIEKLSKIESEDMLAIRLEVARPQLEILLSTIKSLENMKGIIDEI